MRQCVWTVRTTSQEGREGKNTGCVLSRLCNYEASEVDELDRQGLTWGLWLKPTWGRAYLVSISWVRVHWGKSRQESEGRNWSSSHGGALFTELFSPGLLSRLLYHSGLSSQSTQPTVGWDPTVDESGPGPTGQSTGATFSVKFPCLKWLQLSSSWQKTRQERWQSVAFTFNRGARKSPDNTAHLYRPTILHLYLQKKGMFI